MSTAPDDILDILTAYALDALEPEEMARLSDLLANDPELRALYAELRITVDRLPYALPDAEPRPELRQLVLDRAIGRVPKASPTPAPRQQRGLIGLLAGFGTVAVVAVLAALFAFGQFVSVQTQLQQAQAELARQIALNNQVAAVVARQSQTVALAGANGSGTVVRATDGKIMVAANLPPLAEGRVYQFWLIEGQNPPASGGVFTVDAGGSGLLTLQTPGTGGELVFAVTEEPGPNGSPGPTSPPMLISNIPAS